MSQQVLLGSLEPSGWENRAGRISLEQEGDPSSGVSQKWRHQPFTITLADPEDGEGDEKIRMLLSCNPNSARRPCAISLLARWEGNKRTSTVCAPGHRLKREAEPQQVGPLGGLEDPLGTATEKKALEAR